MSVTCQILYTNDTISIYEKYLIDIVSFVLGIWQVTEIVTSVRHLLGHARHFLPHFQVHLEYGKIDTNINIVSFALE